MKPLTRDAINGSRTASIATHLDSACEDRWRQHNATAFCHSPHASDTLRIVSEMYLASQGLVFYFNKESTFQHLVRRLLSNHTKMIPLRTLSSSSAGRNDEACTL
tara:strand:- start:149 stop:463 length:315 start_codon:yes stop_codon:yes gene_type:complete